MVGGERRICVVAIDILGGSMSLGGGVVRSAVGGESRVIAIADVAALRRGEV